MVALAGTAMAWDVNSHTHVVDADVDMTITHGDAFDRGTWPYFVLS